MVVAQPRQLHPWNSLLWVAIDGRLVAVYHWSVLLLHPFTALKNSLDSGYNTQKDSENQNVLQQEYG